MKEQHGGWRSGLHFDEPMMMPDPCTHGHDWQPTIIVGYFQCSRCFDVAACRVCVPKVRGTSMVGVCQQHWHLSTSQVEREEVLAL